MATNNAPPVYERRVPPLKVAVWANPLPDERIVHSVSLTRTYRLPEEQRGEDDNGYRTTSSLRKEDLLPAAQLLEQIFWKLHELESGHSKIDSPEQNGGEGGNDE